MLATMSGPKDKSSSTMAAAATSALASLKEEANQNYPRFPLGAVEDRNSPDFLLEMVPTGKAKNNAKTAHQPLKLFNGSYVLKKELDLCVFVNAPAFRSHYATLSFELTFPDRRVCASFQDGNLLMCRKVDPELNHFHIRLLPKYTVSGKGTRGANNRHNNTVLSVFGDRTLLYSIHFGIYHKSTRVGTNEPDLLRFFRVFVPPSAPDATPSPFASGSSGAFASSGKTLPVMAYFLEKSSLAAPVAPSPIPLPCANLSEIKRFEVLEPPSPSPSPCYSSASSAPSPLPSPSFFYHQQYVQYIQAKSSPKASPPDSPCSTDSGSHSHSNSNSRSGSSSGSSSPSYGAPTPVAQSPSLSTGSPLLLPPVTPPPSHFYSSHYRPGPVSPLYPPLFSPAPSPAPAEYYLPYPGQQQQQQQQHYASTAPPVISVMTMGTGAGDNSVPSSSVVHHHYHYYPSPSAVLSPSFAASPSGANASVPGATTNGVIGGVNGGYYDLTSSSTRSNNGGQTPIYSLLNKGAPSPCPSSSSQSISNALSHSQTQSQSQSQSPMPSPQHDSSNGSSTGSTSGSCAGNNVSFLHNGVTAPSPSPSAAPSPSPYSFYHYAALPLCPSPSPFAFINASPQLYNFHNGGGQTPLFPTPGTPAPFADPDYFDMLLAAASSASASAPSSNNPCPSNTSATCNTNANSNEDNSNEATSLPHSLDVPSSEVQPGPLSPSSSMTDEGQENDQMTGAILPRDLFHPDDQDAQEAERDLWSSDSSASAFMEEHHNVFGGHDDDHHHPLSPHYPS